MSAVIVEGYMEEGVVRLEPRIARIESGVAGLEKRVDQLDGKVERLDESVGTLDRRVAVLEANTENIKENVGRLEVDMRDMRQSFDKKFDSLIDKFGDIHRELRGLTRFMITMFVSFFATLIGFGGAILGVMAKGFHWLK